jgi:hypothetical protein
VAKVRRSLPPKSNVLRTNDEIAGWIFRTLDWPRRLAKYETACHTILKRADDARRSVVQQILPLIKTAKAKRARGESIDALMVLIERKGREANDLLTIKFRRGRPDEWTRIISVLWRKHRAMGRRALWRLLAKQVNGRFESNTPSGDEQLHAIGYRVLTYKAFDHRLDRIVAKEHPPTVSHSVPPPA